ncbi:MAG: protein-L-isoaspartate(D-aspartate) O-methyltransferase [Deltaproteobacteria bacterium]
MMELATFGLISLPIILLARFANDEDESLFTRKRWDMVENQILARGIQNSPLIQAMLEIPRHKFIPPQLSHLAYDDSPVSIELEQTVSQPYIAALMTDLLRLNRGARVLEVGTGSGYQTAILARLGCEVFTVEIHDALRRQAESLLAGMSYGNIRFATADGYHGWSEHSPFDGIIVTAAPNHVPKALVNQLRLNGRMIIPVGGSTQELLLIRKTQEGSDIKTIAPVRFVPMTGEASKSS